MPVEPCQCPGGATGARWGRSGRCYCGPGATAKAAAQGRAAYASGYRDRATVGPAGALRFDAGRLPGAAVRRPLLPDAIERRYTATLLRRVALMRRLLLDALAEADLSGAWDRTVARADRRTDDVLSDLLSVVEVVRRVAGEVVPLSPEEIEAVAADVDGFATAQQAEIFRRIAAVDVFTTAPLRELYASFVVENVDLITSIADTFFEQIRAEVTSAVQTGRRSSELAKDIEGRYSVTQSRAKLIARDQISKLNGQITEQRQTSVGVTRYMWSASGDERVRDTHRANDGQVFEWKRPPATGHPGQDYQCRCVAIPVFDEEDEAALLAEQAARMEREKARAVA